MSVKPRDVPGLRDRLIGNINRALGNLPDAVATGEVRVNDQPVLDAVSNLEWTVRALYSGNVQLIWVSTETLRVAARVAETIPVDTLFTEVERPPWGFAVFETPVEGVDAETGGTVVVDAMSWGPVRLRAVPGTDHLGIGCHTFGGHFSGEGSAHLAEEMPDDLVPIGRSDWLADDPIDVVSQMDDPTAAASMVEDRRLLVALWTLMDSERHTTREAWVPRNKRARRRYDGTPPTVTVVRIRGEAEASGRRGTGSPATHASWVRPHLRRQPYGPGRSLRRLQLIDGHVRRADLGDPVRRDRVWRVD